MNRREKNAYLILRRESRELLSRLQIDSNPGVGDDWIIENLRMYAKLSPVHYIETDDEGLMDFQNSLAQIIVDLGRVVPRVENTSPVIQAENIIVTLQAVIKGLAFNQGWQATSSF